MAKKLFYNDHRFYGQELSVPVDQVILIDEEGYVTVSDLCAEVLLTVPGWEDPGVAKDIPEPPKKIGKGKKDKEAATWLEGIDLDQLQTLSVDELTELAVAGEITGYEKFTHNQKAFAVFMKSKLNKLK